jgi:hypothetical protein
MRIEELSDRQLFLSLTLVLLVAGIVGAGLYWLFVVGPLDGTDFAIAALASIAVGAVTDAALQRRARARAERKYQDLVRLVRYRRTGGAS